MSKNAQDLTVCLRFALIGIGASHFVLSDALKPEQIGLIPELRFFGTMIREHLDQDRVSSAAHIISADCPERAQEIFCHLFDRYISLCRVSGPLDLVMSILVEEFVQEYSVRLGNKLLFFRNRAQVKAFDQEAQKSLRFALNFVERRHHDLEELHEIALIGE